MLSPRPLVSNSFNHHTPMLKPVNNRLLVQFIKPSDSKILAVGGDRADEKIIVLEVADGITWAKRGDEIRILDAAVVKVCGDADSNEPRVCLVRGDAVVAVGCWSNEQAIEETVPTPLALN